jgi:hypothetical protein
LRKQLDDLLAQVAIPADATAAAALAQRYHSDALGKLEVVRQAGATLFDFGAWKSEVASRKHADGTLSFLTIRPGYDIFELFADTTEDGKRRLTLREPQHEHAFVELP